MLNLEVGLLVYEIMKNIERRKEEMEQYIVISKVIWGLVHLTGKQENLFLKKVIRDTKVMGYELITLDELKSN